MVGRFLALLLLTGLLAACGGTPPGESTISSTETQPGEIRRDVAVQAVFVEVGLQPNQLVGAYRDGGGCSGQKLLRWSGFGPLVRSKESLLGAANAALTGAGYRVTRFRAEEGVTGPDNVPDYMAGGAVTAIDLDLCREPSGLVSGTAEVTVDWILMSVASQEVMLWKTVTGHGATGAPSADAESGLVTDAFADAARQLGATPEFKALVPPASGRQAATSQVAAAATFAPLALPRLPPLAGRFSGNSARVQQAVVVVAFSKDQFGSGFYITRDGYLLTDAHVVGDAKNVQVIDDDGATFTGSVVRIDPRRDIALIKVERQDAVPLPLLERKAVVGEEVYAIGAPLDQALTGTVTKGIVSSLRRYEGKGFIQADVDIQPGNSGGPLTDESGNVLGIAVSLLGEGTSIGLNFFIPIDEALAALGVELR